MREELIQKILDQKLIAIVRGLAGGQIVPLAKALLAGGISLIEVTFDQAEPGAFAQTAQAIAAIREACGEAVSAGAGTVMSPEQLRMAHEAGAQFIISPNVDEAVIAGTRALGLVSLPGCMTPTECAAAHSYGADFIKIFPAGVLGPAYIKALKAPLRHLRFMAVGGVGPGNIPDFLQAGAVGFGVGGNLVDRKLIVAGRFAEITELARTYVKACDI
jgi:2-dehydro-3-deoxyphosphogluconate aldolase/(4S)-4-hydroxy-2-oxoglutarate aldolase